MNKGQRGAAKVWLGLTVLLGIAFLGFQAEEHIHAYQELGLTLEFRRIWRDVLYAHGFSQRSRDHRLILQVMLIRIVRVLMPSTSSDSRRQAGTGAVDAVWVALFLFVYVL